MSRRKNPNLKSSNVVDEYTQEMILEMKRCAVDPVYFAMNYVYIKHPVRGRIKFTMFDYQIKMMNKYKNNKHNIVLSARQTGKTETSCAYLLWFSIFHDDKTVLVVSNKATNAMEIISKIQYAYEELPNWLKPGIDENSWNKHECKFDNKSRIVSTTTSKDSGRGLPLSLVYCDEFAFVPTNIQEEFWASILPTLSCITGDSYVLTDDGYRKILDLIPDISKEGLSDFENSIKVFGENELKSSDSYYVSKPSQTLKITTDNDLELKGNLIHPVTVLERGEIIDKQFKDLQLGDHVMVPIGMNKFGTAEIDSDLAYMLGGYIAEGWSYKAKGNPTKHIGISISNQAPEFRQVFLNNGFNVGPRGYESSRLAYYRNDKIKQFEEYGIDFSKKCYNKIIPNQILSLNENGIKNFLQGLFDGDGSVTDRGISLSSTSYELIYQVKLLLNNFGIMNRILKIDGGKRLTHEQKTGRLMPQGKPVQSLRDSYQLHVALSDSKLFMDKIGFRIQYKCHAANKLIQNIQQNNHKKYRIPYSQVSCIISDILTNNNWSHKFFRDRGLRLDKLFGNKQKYINIQWLTKFVNIVLYNNGRISRNHYIVLDKLINLSCYWDEITNIEDNGIHPTYDLRVPDGHRFIQNGIVGHNTGGSIIISSTPNGDTDKFSTLWRGAELGTNEFSHGMTFVPWYAHPDRDEAFKERMIGLLGERKWKQEYECQFLTSEQTLIDQYAINQREAYINANLTKAFELMGIPFWNKINPSSSYIVSCDPATGSGEDYSVIQVYEFPSLEQVCEWRNNSMDIPQLYNVFKNILRFLARFTNNIYFSVENNGIGQGVLSLYQADDNFPEQAFLISDGGKNLGITTTVKNKIPSCIKLKQMFESGIIKINSKIVLTEMKNFVRLENTYKAKTGATDDAISACLLLIKILEHMADSDANAYDKIYSQSLDAFKDEFDAMGDVNNDEYAYAPSFMII